MLPCPTESPASGKMQGQWEIPLSFHPHDIPIATLASDMTAHKQASVQSKSEAPQANSKTVPSPAALAQQETYDLLADIPAFQTPKRSLALWAYCMMRIPRPEDVQEREKQGLLTHPTTAKKVGVPIRGRWNMCSMRSLPYAQEIRNLHWTCNNLAQPVNPTPQQSAVRSRRPTLSNLSKAINLLWVSALLCSL